MPGERAYAPQRLDELAIGLDDHGTCVVERDLELVEVERDVDAAGVEELRQLLHLVHVPLRMVVREDRAGDVGLSAGGRQVARCRGDRVFRAPRVRDAVAVPVESPPLPGRGHELHPADRAGGARPHVAAEVRLDLVDRGEYLPGDAVGRARLLPEVEQLRVRAGLGDERITSNGVGKRDRARRIRAIGARQGPGHARRGPGEHGEDVAARRREHAERVGCRRARQRERQRNRRS